MKICPFISHMIGEERANVLEVDGRSGNTATDSTDLEESAVVVLGYDDEGGVGTNSKTKSKTRGKGKSKGKGKGESSNPSHLFCLQETCRFYQTESSTCQFDTMFDLATAHSTESDSYKEAVEKSAVEVNKGLDRFWKFQTRSVTELISSFGDAERRQKDAFDELKEDLSEKLLTIESSQPPVDITPFRDDIAKLQEHLITRDDGLEDFSTTLSEIVLNVEEGIRAVKESQDALAEKVGSMSLPDGELTSLRDNIVSAIEDKLNEAISEMSAQHKAWESRLDELARKQEEMAGKLKSNVDVSSNATSQRQKDAKKLNNLGVSSFHNGELELARQQFLESIAIDERFAEAQNNLGLVCSELGDEKAASNAFTRAIELDPDLHAAYNNLGYLYYKQNSYEDAVEMYNEALGRQSDNSTAYTNLGNAYYKLDRYEEAQAAWEKALELDPTNEKAGRSLRRLQV